MVVPTEFPNTKRHSPKLNIIGTRVFVARIRAEIGRTSLMIRNCRNCALTLGGFLKYFLKGQFFITFAGLEQYIALDRPDIAFSVTTALQQILFPRNFLNPRSSCSFTLSELGVA